MINIDVLEPGLVQDVVKILSAALDTEKDKVRGLESRIRRDSEALGLAETTILRLTQQMEAKDAAMRTIRLKLVDSEVQGAAFHANGVHLQSQIKSLSATNEDIQSKLRDRDAQLQSTEAKLQSLQSELQAARDRNAALESENQGLLEQRDYAIDSLAQRLVSDVIREEEIATAAREMAKASAADSLGDVDLELESFNSKVPLPNSTPKQIPGMIPIPRPTVAQRKKERERYFAHMGGLPLPSAGRPLFDDLKPIAKLGSYDWFKHDIAMRWRSVWCDNNARIHAIVFAPTHVYSGPDGRWVENQSMGAYCGRGRLVEYFATGRKDFVYYAGTYVVHSLRDVHPPGGVIPTDVSDHAIYLQTGLAESEQQKVKECPFFPDGHIRTECFGLQCVGFNHELYRVLRERYERDTGVASTLDAGTKRKAGEEGLDERKIKDIKRELE
ncbi:hypothetical protein FB45DRAFT_898123 [Roridomyces roridus]|uniref:Uncharacterized protein n=1 Tax=Roridomyces roridus TaxID=1738132 RepID=A0AAD7CBZ7_9AGAR|nr:hypothetical protein FB45DRAFT_898123 [Roridomyces roridus]